MEEIQKTKTEIRNEIFTKMSELTEKSISEKTQKIEERLFEFANFLESKITLLYLNHSKEVLTKGIIDKCFEYNKIVVLPFKDASPHEFRLLKIDDPETDLKPDINGYLKPDTERCKAVPVDRIDIAIIPGIAFDEKGGRVGSGDGYYNRLIPKLPITTRKVALAFEEQIVQIVPNDTHDKYVDIIITDERIIYKI